VTSRLLLLIFLILVAGAALAREPESYPSFPSHLTAPAAVRAAARLAHALRDPLVAERLDLPPDVLDAARRDCLEAARGPLPAEARADALSCAADLGADVRSFLGDAQAPVRAAAAALLGARARKELLPLAGDADPEVAATALGLLCADDARTTLGDLDDAGRARVAALSADRSVDRGHAAELALCLPDRPAKKKR